jgi:hypothetical protein
MKLSLTRSVLGVPVEPWYRCVPLFVNTGPTGFAGYTESAGLRVFVLEQSAGLRNFCSGFPDRSFVPRLGGWESKTLVVKRFLYVEKELRLETGFQFNLGGGHAGLHTD